jgi:hypothetical protein
MTDEANITYPSDADLWTELIKMSDNRIWGFDKHSNL